MSKASENYTNRYKTLEVHKIIFFIMMGIHFLPTLLTRLYKLLQHKPIFIGYLIISLFLFFIPFAIIQTNTDPKIIRSYSLLCAPLLFILTYKSFDIICLKTQKRHLIMANRFTLLPNEKPKFIDYIGFLFSVLIPLLLPLGLLENVL